MNQSSKVTFIDRVQGWLNGADRLLKTAERVVVDKFAATTPWLGPIPSAYMTYDSMLHNLNFPNEIALAGAAVVEFLGLATIHTALGYWGDRSLSRSKQMWVALGTGLFYIVVVITFAVVMDNGEVVHKFGKALLCMPSVIGAVTVALRSHQAKETEELRVASDVQAQIDRHKREADEKKADMELQARLAEMKLKAEAELAEKKLRLEMEAAENQRRHEERMERLRLRAELRVESVGQRLGNGATPLGNDSQPFWKRSKNFPLFEQHYQANPNISPTELAALAGKNRGTAHEWLVSRRQSNGVHHATPTQG